MPVTELALLHLKTTAASLLSTLQAAATKQATFSGYPVTLLRCVEDPEMIYLVGGWKSVAQHMEVWIPGLINQEILRDLEGDVDVNWMFHVRAEPGEVRGLVRKVVGGGDGYTDGEGSGDGVVAVGRYFVEDQKGFEGAYEGGVDGLEGRVMGGKGGLAGGWREDVGFESGDAEGKDSDAEKDRDWKNDFVLFTAWGSVQEHFDFAKTEGFNRWARIKDFMSGAEIRHGKVLFVAEPSVGS